MISAQIREAAEDAIPERHQSLAEDISAVLEAVEPLIRRDERQRIANEMLALREELKVVGRLSAAAVMHDMWQRVTRRLDK